MPYPDLPRGVGVAQPEGWIDLRDRLIPAQLAFVDHSASSSVVIALVSDAVRNSVSAPTGSGEPSVLTPKPPSNTIRPPSIRLKPTPGIEKRRICSVTKSLIRPMRSASSGWAARERFPLKPCRLEALLQ
jgi:hypothetical protein